MAAQRAGEGVDAALGRRVVEQLLVAHDPGDRAGIDDRAAGLHVRHRLLRHVEIAVEIGLHRAVELLLGEVLEARDVLLERRVVDQDVELAEFLDGAPDHIGADPALADVAGDGEAAPPLVLDRPLGHRRVLVLVEIEDGDIGALAGEQHRHRPADAGIAAGDDRHRILQLARALVVGRVVHRRRVELGLAAGLRQMLLREGRLGVAPRPRLHRALALLRGRAPVGARHPALDLAMLRRRARHPGGSGLPRHGSILACAAALGHKR